MEGKYYHLTFLLSNLQKPFLALAHQLHLSKVIENACYLCHFLMHKGFPLTTVEGNKYKSD